MLSVEGTGNPAPRPPTWNAGRRRHGHGGLLGAHGVFGLQPETPVSRFSVGSRDSLSTTSGWQCRRSEGPDVSTRVLPWRGHWWRWPVVSLAALLVLVGCGPVRSAPPRRPTTPSTVQPRGHEYTAPSPSPATDVEAFAMSSPTNGAEVAGSTLYQTADGGKTWHAVRTVSATASLDALSSGSLLLLSVRAAGRSQLDLSLGSWSPHRAWTFQSARVTSFLADGAGAGVPPDITCSFTNVTAGWCLLDMGGGMQLNDAQVWETTTAGTTWAALTTAPTPAGTVQYGYKGGIAWAPGTTGWMTASTVTGGPNNSVNPVLYRTRDGGLHWVPVGIPYLSVPGRPGTVDLGPPRFLPLSGGWAILETATNASATATILRVLVLPSPDAQTWLPTGTPVGVPGVPGDPQLFPATPTTWWLWTGRALYQTKDAGRQWHAVPLPPALRGGGPIAVSGSHWAWMWVASRSGSSVLWQWSGQRWAPIFGQHTRS